MRCAKQPESTVCTVSQLFAHLHEVISNRARWSDTIHTRMLQYFACEKPLHYAKFRLIQVLCDLRSYLCVFRLRISQLWSIPKLLQRLC